MKLVINKNEITDNPEQFLRGAGYGFIRDRQTGGESYVRRLGSHHYPRLHMYVDEVDGKVSFNLHLDQKQTSYAGAHRHNAEYDGEVVEGEIERLRTLIGNGAGGVSEAPTEPRTSDPLQGMQAGSIDDIQPKSKKKWWKFWA